MQTYGDASQAVHDADRRHLGGLPLHRLHLVVVGVVVCEERLRNRADVVDI